MDYKHGINGTYGITLELMDTLWLFSIEHMDYKHGINGNYGIVWNSVEMQSLMCNTLKNK